MSNAPDHILSTKSFSDNIWRHLQCLNQIVFLKNGCRGYNFSNVQDKTKNQKFKQFLRSSFIPILTYKVHEIF